MSRKISINNWVIIVITRGLNEWKDKCFVDEKGFNIREKNIKWCYYSWFPWLPFSVKSDININIMGKNNKLFLLMPNHRRNASKLSAPPKPAIDDRYLWPSHHCLDLSLTQFKLFVEFFFFWSFVNVLKLSFVYLFWY
jgi:hypothetical protein